MCYRVLSYKYFCSGWYNLDFYNNVSCNQDKLTTECPNVFSEQKSFWRLSGMLLEYNLQYIFSLFYEVEIDLCSSFYNASTQDPHHMWSDKLIKKYKIY